MTEEHFFDQWFAWYPIKTKNRGWKWLTKVNRHKTIYPNAIGKDIVKIKYS